MARRKRRHAGDHVALISGDAALDAGGDFFEVEVHAESGDVFCLDQIIKKFATAAAQVEDARVRLDPVSDDLHVHGAFFDGLGHG